LFQEPFPGGSDGDAAAAAATLTPCFIFLRAHGDLQSAGGGGSLNMHMSAGAPGSRAS